MHILLAQSIDTILPTPCPKRSSPLNTHSNDFIRRYIEHVTSCKRKNRFVSRFEGWEWCSWWRESCWCTKVSFLG